MSRLPPRSRPRRGIATLEMVLCLPFLLVLAALLFTMGQGGIARIQTTVAARHQAWKKRDPVSSPQALQLFGDPAQELVREKASQRVRLPRFLAGTDDQARSEHAVLGGGSWGCIFPGSERGPDYHAVPFSAEPRDIKTRLTAMALSANNLPTMAIRLRTIVQGNAEQLLSDIRQTGKELEKTNVNAVDRTSEPLQIGANLLELFGDLDPKELLDLLP